MDPTPPEAAGRPAEPDDFAPLRLVLQPTGAVLEVDRPDVIVGRHSGADVRMCLPDVSRRHCRLFLADGRWHVVDLDSLNGVWVNEQSVDQAVLGHGDTLRLGGFTFIVDLSNPSAAESDQGGVLRSIFSALPPPGDPAEEPRRRAS